MSFIQHRLTVSQSLAQHQFMVGRTIERLFGRTVLSELPVSQAVRAWYRDHPPRVRSLLRHEEPLYTALAIMGDPGGAQEYESGPNRERYLKLVAEALDDWWSQHPELYMDGLGDDESVMFGNVDDTI